MLMSAYWPGETNPALFASPADAVAPSRILQDNPPAATGKKVVFADADHNNWKGKDPRFVWKNFVRGNNVIIFDAHVVPFDWDRGAVGADDGSYEPLRWAVGHTRSYAERLSLAAMAPRNDLASTQYCLANPGNEYLVYLPDGGEVTLDLSAVKGTLAVEWFNPRTNEKQAGDRVDGGAKRTFRAPFEGDAVLYLSGE
ncbi:hypothetical protein FJY63_08670 [Candidatus Sumerlaeota bacterium]|nr:hypothetical protein [Candidatus Sumerlaeota bacterium]